MIANISDDFVNTGGVDPEDPLSIYAREMKRIVEEEEGKERSATNIRRRSLRLQKALFGRFLVKEERPIRPVFAKVIKAFKKKKKKEGAVNEPV